MKQIVANDQIESNSIRLIDLDGKQLGIFTKIDALEIADSKGLDLIQVSTGIPTVCRLVILDKYKYDMQKAEKGRRKRSRASIVKEIYFRPATSQHDIETKVNHIKKFIAKGFVVKVGVKFRGREHTHKDIGRDILEGVLELIGDMATTMHPISTQGNIMSMTLRHL